MQKATLPFWLALCLIVATARHAQFPRAQIHQGTITYERKIDIHRLLKDAQMRAMMPQFKTSEYQLLFRDSISVYKAVPADEAPDPLESSGGGGTHVIMKFGTGDDGVLYENFGSGQLLEEASLQDKKYIITDTVKPMPWKLSRDTATILGYTCKIAFARSSRGGNVIAWYCEDIPLPVGPDKLIGLPGAVLRLDVDSGGVVYTATKVLPSVSVKELKAPAGSPMMTRADFAKKMDEVMGPADSQGRRMTIRQN